MSDVTRTEQQPEVNAPEVTAPEVTAPEAETKPEAKSANGKSANGKSATASSKSANGKSATASSKPAKPAAKKSTTASSKATTKAKDDEKDAKPKGRTKFAAKTVNGVAQTCWWKRTSKSKLATEFDLTEDEVDTLRASDAYREAVMNLMVGQRSDPRVFADWYKTESVNIDWWVSRMGLDKKQVPGMFAAAKKVHARIVAGEVKPVKYVPSPDGKVTEYKVSDDGKVTSKRVAKA